MDGAPLASVIREQLKGATGLASLQLQNHIYGCFIIMEDIAQQTATLTENQLVSSNAILSLDQEFNRIGLQFGFVMNSKLGLASVNPTYQTEWCKVFRELSSIEQVDSLEDAIIEVIHETVSAEDAYFSHALESGSLPQEWLAKIVGLLNSSEKKEEVAAMVVTNTSTTVNANEPQPSAIGLANIEKNRPIKKGRLARTRRSKPTPVKAPLATTRRRK
jgi:hypothetical protein